MTKKLNLTGEVYGRLKVRKQHSFGVNPAWECICECGTEVIKSQINLRTGDTKSCGCLKRERTIKRNTTHGGSYSYTYKKWKGMHGRVRHPVNKSICYKGVEISSVWKEFVVFLHDMGECPNGYSLDRIDSTKGYSADNCRWIPLEEQASNTSKNRKIVYNGIEACVSTHAKSKGLHPDLVFDRLNKLGWAIDKALDTPKKKNYHN